MVEVNPSGVNYLCSGSTFTASVAEGAAGYQWLDNSEIIAGATAASYQVTGPGSYQVAVRSADNCLAVSDVVIVFAKSSPAIPVVTFNGSSLISSESPNGYQWYKNGEQIVGATNQTLVLTENGTYFVEVSGNNDCYSRSEEINITNIGIQSQDAVKGLSVYPNPFGNNLTIQSSSEGVYSITDVSGKSLLSGKLNGKQGVTWINTEFLAAGMYQLRIQQDGLPEKMMKLIK